MSRCGTPPLIRVRGGPYGSTPPRGSPATARRSRPRRAGPGRWSPAGGAPGGPGSPATHRGDQVVDEAALARARRMAGLKGYVSNIPAGVMGADEVIASYHELWHVEQSFRMTRARPENPPDLPPHPRRDRGPPDRRDGLPGRRPPPATGHRDEHQATRPRTQTTSRGHHQRQRPPPHRPTPTHRNRTANPQQSGSGALNWHDSGGRPRRREVHFALESDGWNCTLECEVHVSARGARRRPSGAERRLPRTFQPAPRRRSRPAAPSYPQDVQFPPVSRVFSAGFGEVSPRPCRSAWRARRRARPGSA